MRYVLVLMLAACSHVKTSPKPSQVNLDTTPWCFTGIARVGSTVTPGLFCADRRAACDSVRNGVIQFGAIKGVQSVTKCARVSGSGPR
jgi:hypothetical protein